MNKVILHYAVSYEAHGETRIRSLCNRARADVVNTEAIERGQNVSSDPLQVTCSFCKRILPKRLKIEQAAEAA